MEFIVREGSLQEKFLQSRKKIQFYGGGYGNGKTSCACVKAIMLMKDYPNSYGAILRATLPKLKGSTMKEFFKWLPESWIKSFNKQDRTLELVNGSKCLFTYLGQKGSGDNTTSNVLSSTFDWVLVDQFEDPEFSHKDFTDLLGRLRGSAVYNGDDVTMPKTGPRWLFFLTNPTRNWVYNKIVKPVHMYNEKKVVTNDLLIDDKGELIIDIIEGSTYDNKDNLPEDFISTMEATYKGQMRDRFLNGQWSAYEGLIYPSFDPNVHMVTHRCMLEYLKKIEREYKIEFVESFDFGQAVPSCYLLGFVDKFGFVHVVDGFYKSGLSYDNIVKEVNDIRDKYQVDKRNFILADPSIWRKVVASCPSIYEELFSRGLNMDKADNDILNGIMKVTNYLELKEMQKSPYDENWGSPSLYFSDKLQFLYEEITDYFWKKTSDDKNCDKPKDVDDHAMDSLKYLLTKQHESAILREVVTDKYAQMYKWREVE